MKKFFVTALCLGILIIIFLSNNGVSENIVNKDFEDNNSKKYDVSVTDDSIYFTDELGNGIFYNFEGDKVTSVLSFVKTDTIETAEELKKAYLENLNSGDIKDITASEDGLFIYYSDAYISNFDGYTKDEIQNMLVGEM